MNIIYLLIGVSLIFIILIVIILFWAFKSGQYDDLEGEGHRLLMDDDDVSDQ